MAAENGTDPAEERPLPRARTSRRFLLGACVSATMVLAVGAAVGIVLARPAWMPGVVLGLLLVIPVVWVTASALWPAEAKRTCPACGAEALERIDQRSTYGLACGSCGWRDESASAWLLAEEEGVLEDVVLRQRGRAARPGGKRERSPVDSSARGD